MSPGRRRLPDRTADRHCRNITRISILAVSMAVTRALATLSRLIRRTPPPPDDVLDAYAHEVIPVLDRAEWLYQYWLEQSMLFTDSEKLGNVAAIHRWETATMGRSLERVVPPAVLAGAHESVIDALELASRAAQLLSSGSRFHNANAVCEGQSLLGTSRERRLAALKAMRRYLHQSPPQPSELALAPGLAAEAASPPIEPVPPPPVEAPTSPVVADHVAEPLPAPPNTAPPLPAAPPAPAPPASAPPEPSPPPSHPQEPIAPPGWGTLFDRSGSQSER
jgi:hypothetical protein